jgi:4-hydroxy-tetrahydrodipicolinate synthase
MTHFQGTITAIITPFRDGKLDLAALEKLVEAQITGGVDGIVPCGTTGESPTLSQEEHLEVVRRVVKQVRGRVPVIAGAGSNNTQHALHLSQAAADCGATGLLHVSPYYNKPTQEGLYQHFSKIARDVKLPIMLYNIPGRCGVEISIETIRRLHAEHENIVAVKHATGRVDDAAELMSICKIDVLSGDDPITLPLMSLGAIGVVSVMSNLVPRSVKRLTQAALAGDMAAARAAHERLHPLTRGLLSREVNPIPIKTAMAMRGYCTEEFRLPMCAISAQNRPRVEALLKRHPLD